MNRKRIVVIGDRVLIKPDRDEERTKVGLYLPQTVKDKEDVVGGTVVQTGPGIPLADPADLSEEPWKRQSKEMKFLPVQASAGDYALFLQKAGVEITYQGEQYVIVPQSAILVLIRDEDLDENQDESSSEEDFTDY
jgi:co-chaperonin GroES (HSP10)